MEYKLIRKDTWVAALLLFLFMACMFLCASKQGLCFDTSYNLISYQNLFNGKGFVYDYAGQRVPFDPVISSGPELYLPAMLLWFIQGHTNYWSSVNVLVGYTAIFLFFLFFYVLKGENKKSFSFCIFLYVFLFRKQFFFGNAIFITPLGEPLSVFFIFSGIYLLYEKRFGLIPFLIVGLGLDVKTNTAVSILPVLALLWFMESFIPEAKNRDYKALVRSFVFYALGAIIVLLPFITYTKVVPSIVLEGNDKVVWNNAKSERSRFMAERGFGHIVEAIREAKKSGDAWTFFAIYNSKLKEKFVSAKSFFKDSSTIITLYFAVFFALWFFSFRKKHFAFYIFGFSFFIYVWWFFACGDAWYRYWSTADLMFVYGVVSISPLLYEFRKSKEVILISILSLYVYLPQVSVSEILRHIDSRDKHEYLDMADRISSIDDGKIFGYGWFQAPHLMFLSGKRFQDFTDNKALKAAVQRYDKVYFLSTIENTIIKEDMERIAPLLQLDTEYGYCKLYEITKAPEL